MNILVTGENGQLGSELNNNGMIGYNIVDLAGNFSGNDLVLKYRKHSEHGNLIGRKEKLDLILNEIESLTEKQEKLDNTDYLILLDDKGKSFTSTEFAALIQKKMISSVKTLVFVVGGAFGFSNEVYQRANAKLSLSKMTFSHQMVRLIFKEQLYRAFSILKGEKYHHE